MSAADIRSYLRILNDSTDLNPTSEAEQIAVIQRNPSAIQYIKNPSEALQLAAVRQNGLAIQYIENPSEAVQLAAVQENGYAIRYIKRPSEAVQLAAVKRYPDAIEYIENPSEQVKLAAVNKNGLAIQYIKNPSEALQLAAVQRGYEIKHIENPSEAVQLAAVQKNGDAIQYIKNPTEAVQLAAVKQYAPAIKYIETTSERVILTAILQLIKSNKLDIDLYLKYKNEFPDWPEWAAIDRSLRASGIINEGDKLKLYSEEELLNEGKWNEEILKNLIRATIAGFIAYGGLEAKRLTTPLDTQRLDALFQQLEKEDQIKLKKTIKTLSHDERRSMNTVGKHIKQSGKIPEQDKIWLKRIIDRAI